jgi:hypothetical protein
MGLGRCGFLDDPDDGALLGRDHRDRGLGDPSVPSAGGAGTADASTSAMRILEDRFARGEIDADEFQRRREILRGGG